MEAEGRLSNGPSALKDPVELASECEADESEREARELLSRAGELEARREALFASQLEGPKGTAAAPIPDEQASREKGERLVEERANALKMAVGLMSAVCKQKDRLRAGRSLTFLGKLLLEEMRSRGGDAGCGEGALMVLKEAKSVLCDLRDGSDEGSDVRRDREIDVSAVDLLMGGLHMEVDRFSEAECCFRECVVWSLFSLSCTDVPLALKSAREEHLPHHDIARAEARFQLAVCLSFQEKKLECAASFEAAASVYDERVMLCMDDYERSSEVAESIRERAKEICESFSEIKEAVLQKAKGIVERRREEEGT